jgi:ubiquinone/menaquinone biosynthesis C-methylase UbiE
MASQAMAGIDRRTRQATAIAGGGQLLPASSERSILANTRFAVDRFYEDANSLFVRAYDAFYVGGAPIGGDVAFYGHLARETGGGVLELACGTGRIALALAEAGLEVTGVDISEGMLSVARRKAAARPLSVQQRLTLIQQDISELNLGRRFGFAFVPVRSFQHLLTIDRQRRALEAMHRHLESTGRLVLHLFDPRLDLLIDANIPWPGLSGTHPETGCRYAGEMLRTRFDHLNQVRRDLWRYTELAPNGAVIAQDTREMALRWTYRWELHHLLSLCGFMVEAEYSDFGRSPPAYGKELILVAQIA